MNLGDPNFVDVTKYVSDMLSPSFAKQIQQKILDNTTFPPEYYTSRFGPFYLVGVNLIFPLPHLVDNINTVLAYNLQVESAERSRNQPFLHCRRR